VNRSREFPAQDFLVRGRRVCGRVRVSGGGRCGEKADDKFAPACTKSRLPVVANLLNM
jgi:hypothetical protein